MSTGDVLPPIYQGLYARKTYRSRRSAMDCVRIIERNFSSDYILNNEFLNDIQESKPGKSFGNKVDGMWEH